VAAIVGTIFSPVFLKAFTLTFVAEWGDRSQIATIGLAASQDVVRSASQPPSQPATRPAARAFQPCAPAPGPLLHQA
jgi:hypothetical protein